MLVKDSERAWQSLGKVHYGPTEAERAASKRRRSIYVSKDLAPGEILSPENIKIVRPGHGLEPKHWTTVVGRRAARAAKMGDPVTWDLITNG